MIVLDAKERMRQAIMASCPLCVSRSLQNYLSRFQDPGAAARREALLADKMGLYAKLAEPQLREKVANG